MKNVLLITTDQQHFMTLGINNPEVKTPNLDYLFKQGVSMDRAYCPNPTCTPSRASIITGVYPSMHKAWTLGTKLDENYETIGDLLLPNNIATSLIGKAHFQQLFEDDEGKYKSLESYPILQDLDFWKDYDEPFYGFENYKLLRNHTNESHVGQHYAIWLNEKSGDKWKDYYLEETGNVKLKDYHSDKISPHGQFPQGRVWDIPLDLHYNEFITSESINQIQHDVTNGQSFFTWASYPDPHPDYLVPKKYAEMYNPDDIEIPETYYENEINPIELLTKTREINPDFSDYDETGTAIHGCSSHIQDEKSLKRDIALYYGMVTYLDDEVGKLIKELKDLNIYDDTLIIFTTDHGHYYGQHKLVRKGPFMYEDAVRIPFLVSGGGYKYPTKRCEELVSLVDIFPTICEHLNVEFNEYDIQGKSMIPLLEKEVNEDFRTGLFCEFRHEPFALNLRTYIEKRYKITVVRGTDFGEIYDLKNDPNEMNNLWDNEELRARLLLKYIYASLDLETLHMPRICAA